MAENSAIQLAPEILEGFCENAREGISGQSQLWEILGHRQGLRDHGIKGH
jgi:hypothetical protein